MDMGLVRKAMAFRVKYRVSSGKERMPLARLGVHPQTRGGMYPQPDAVRNLGVHIMATGFNGSESDHEGVCVEDMPLPRSSSASVVEPYEDYNLRQCDHQFLKKCFSILNCILYGTLSHSHLLLVLLAWANGADWNVEDEPNLCKLLNPYGSFYNAAVAACDADLERVLRDGLSMEVLCWKMLWRGRPQPV